VLRIAATALRMSQNGGARAGACQHVAANDSEAQARPELPAGLVPQLIPVLGNFSLSEAGP